MILPLSAIQVSPAGQCVTGFVRLFGFFSSTHCGPADALAPLRMVVQFALPSAPIRSFTMRGRAVLTIILRWTRIREEVPFDVSMDCDLRASQHTGHLLNRGVRVPLARNFAAFFDAEFRIYCAHAMISLLDNPLVSNSSRTVDASLKKH